MSRLALLGLVFLLATASSVATGAPRVADARPEGSVGVMRLVAPDFGYAVGGRTRQVGTTSRTRHVLRVFDGGRWRDATPAALRPPAFPRDGIDGVDDVWFVSRRDGWIATFNCSKAAVRLFHTTDGGRSWRSL